MKSENCETDYLEVRDGYFIKSPIIGRFCGRRSEILTTKSSRMLLTYHNSNLDKDYNGFKANFEGIRCLRNILKYYRFISFKYLQQYVVGISVLTIQVSWSPLTILWNI